MIGVSVVIPTYDGKALLDAYLPSVLEAAEVYRGRGGEAEVVVVDDGSRDGTPAWLAARHPDAARLVVHERNLGLAAACNRGFREARHPVVLLLNNDVRLDADCIEPMAGHFADPGVFAVTGKIFNQRGDTFCNGGKIARFRRGMWSTYENYDVLPSAPPATELLSFTAIGAFSAFDRAKLVEVGGLDPLVFLVEDVEVSYRGWKRGWVVRYEPRSVAYHDASRTMDVLFRRRTLDRISRRSRIVMHWMLLHDPPMFRRHVAYLVGRFLTSWLALDWRFYWAIATGLGQLGRIRANRRETRRTMVRGDRELLELLERFYRSAPIAPRRT